MLSSVLNGHEDEGTLADFPAWQHAALHIATDVLATAHALVRVAVVLCASPAGHPSRTFLLVFPASPAIVDPSLGCSGLPLCP